MEQVTVRDVNDPGFQRTVALRAWNLWPKSKEIPGARLAQGKRHMVVIGEEAGDKIIAERTAPRIPEVVERVMVESKAAAEQAPAEAVEVTEPVAHPTKKGPKAKK